MTVRSQISVSLDGYVAGPEPTVDQPLGVNGESLHEWVFPLAAWRKPHGLDGGEVNANSAVLEESTAGIGATVMGRNMFGGGPGDWGDGSWTGWWGDEPPFGHPVFVLTHHPRERLELGATSFDFVTDGIRVAIDAAKNAAAGQGVMVSGGAETIQQALEAGLLDELQIHLVPVLLGSGTKLFANLEGDAPKLEPVDVVAGPGVTHIRYKVG